MSEKLILSPSILAGDFGRLGEQIKQVEQAGAKYLHIDVMDGVFVPSISFGMPVIKSLRKQTDLFFDVHLMITDPERYISEFVDCGAEMITFHLEEVTDVKHMIESIRTTGAKVGIAIKPDTPAEQIYSWLSLVDMVLVMTVEPGFGGQTLLPHCVEKVRQVRKYLRENELDVDVQVDGGVTMENVGILTAAGANVIVAGSTVFSGDVLENARELLSRM